MRTPNPIRSLDHYDLPNHLSLQLAELLIPSGEYESQREVLKRTRDLMYKVNGGEDEE